ncbi:MAG: DUF4288 domain-containing protein [Syntrophomonas sp.]
MKHNRSRKKRWQWYGVKLLYESVISGKPTPEAIDKYYSNAIKTFEESIVLVYALSFDHAYKIAENQAKDNQISYHNYYNELVEWNLVQAIDCFVLIDDVIKTGTEVYSRFISVPKEISNETVISRFFPESEDLVEDNLDYKWVLRNRDLNK